VVNPATNFAGTSLGQISGKWAGSKFAGAGAEVQYNAKILSSLSSMFLLTAQPTSTTNFSEGARFHYK